MSRRKPKINDEAANKAVKFIESLKHTKGKWAGVPFQLMSWQRDDVIRPLFGTLKPDGARQYQTVYVEIPKKNGKSELAAAVALKCLLADNEPGAEVYGAAADKAQAGIVFNVAAQMVRQSKILSKRCKILDSQKRIVVYKTNSFYQVLSSDVPTKHGLNPHAVIFDELHAQPNRLLWDVLTFGAGDARVQPIIFVLTTAGYDRNSICWEQHDYAIKVQKGIIEDPTFLPVIYAADKKADWEKEEVWKKCNPSLGEIIDIEKVRTAYKKAVETPALQNTFKRLRLNIWTQQETRWLDINKWDTCTGIVVPEKLKGRDCFAGIDAASSNDIAALVLVFPPTEGESKHQILPYFWIPKENLLERVKKDRVNYDVWERQGYITATEGNVINYKAIQLKIEELGRYFNIKEIGYDPWGMVQLSQILQDDSGFNMIQMRQGFGTMAAPTKELLTLVLRKAINHGGNPVLRWMADNMVVKQDPAGNVKPDKSKSIEKIDGMVALIMALDRAIRNKSDNKSVYDEGGIKEI